MIRTGVLETVGEQKHQYTNPTTLSYLMKWLHVATAPKLSIHYFNGATPTDFFKDNAHLIGLHGALYLRLSKSELFI